MSERVIFRDLRHEIVEEIAAIAVAAWEPIYAHSRMVLGDALFLARSPDWRAQKAGQIRRACVPESPAHVRVATIAGQVVGFVTFYLDAKTGVGRIGNNAIAPAFQGRGIGTMMYEDTLARMRELGMRFAEVGTGGDPAHAPARRAYEKAGFNICVPDVRYYREL